MRLSKTLHASGEDYMETILVLQKKLGMVRSVDVARHMEVSKPSVCHAVSTLRDGGFLTMDEDHFLQLTDVGREVAEKIYERHCFFTEQLIAAGVDPKTVEADACRLEHIISDESFSRLKEAAAQEQMCIRDRGCTIIISEHKLYYLKDLADRVVTVSYTHLDVYKRQISPLGK